MLREIVLIGCLVLPLAAQELSQMRLGGPLEKSEFDSVERCQVTRRSAFVRNFANHYIGFRIIRRVN